MDILSQILDKELAFINACLAFLGGDVLQRWNCVRSGGGVIFNRCCCVGRWLKCLERRKYNGVMTVWIRWERYISIVTYEVQHGLASMQRRKTGMDTACTGVEHTVIWWPRSRSHLLNQISAVVMGHACIRAHNQCWRSQQAALIMGMNWAGLGITVGCLHKYSRLQVLDGVRPLTWYGNEIEY